MDKELEQILKDSERYNTFILFQKPEKFCEYFKNKDYYVVQTHSTEVFKISGKKDIVGFCGQFGWKNNMITPLDGDSYSKTMSVYGYEEFDCDEGKGLDILVGDEW